MAKRASLRFATKSSRTEPTTRAADASAGPAAFAKPRHEVRAQAETLRQYISQAIANEDAGLEIDFQPKQANMPEEFQQVLDDSPDIRQAFYALTPGRQRAYLLHFAEAKQSKTRSARIEKYIPRILDGKGMLDRD